MFLFITYTKGFLGLNQPCDSSPIITEYSFFTFKDYIKILEFLIPKMLIVGYGRREFRGVGVVCNFRETFALLPLKGISYKLMVVGFVHCRVQAPRRSVSPVWGTDLVRARQ